MFEEAFLSSPGQDAHAERPKDAARTSNRWRVALVAALIVACGGTRPPVEAAPPASTSGGAPFVQPAPRPTLESDAAAEATPITAPSAPPQPKPAPVARSGSTWPFHAWTRAEAVAFNQFPMQRVQVRAYDDDGWSPHLKNRQPISDRLAKRAVELLVRTQGDVEVSKCPFPRHAVVLFDGEVPVASINICFACGDILIWPPWDARERDWGKLTPTQQKQDEVRAEKQMKSYKVVFPLWKSLFRDDIGFPIDAAYH